MKSRFALCALIFALINFLSLPAAQASNRVLVVSNPVVEIGLGDKSEKTKWIVWVKERIACELAKSKNVTIRDEKGKSGQPQQIADFMVLSQLTVIGHNAIAADSLKSKQPCTVSFDLRLVTFSDSSILGAANARNDKAKWPGYPSSSGDDISKSKLAKMVDPLIKKACATLLKSFR